MNYRDKYQFGTDVSMVFCEKIERLLKNKKVLDLGCGKGDYLERFGKGSVGLDLSPKNVIAARQQGHKVIECDLNNPPVLKNKFDAVFSSHLLEHLDCPIDLFRYAGKNLNKGGLFVLSIPNEASPIHLRYPYFTKNGNHLYSFSVNNILELLEVSGFKCIEIHYDYYTELTSKLHLNFLLRLLDHLPSYFSQKIAWSFWFVAKKK